MPRHEDIEKSLFRVTSSNGQNLDILLSSRSTVHLVYCKIVNNYCMLYRSDTFSEEVAELVILSPLKLALSFESNFQFRKATLDQCQTSSLNGTWKIVTRQTPHLLVQLFTENRSLSNNLLFYSEQSKMNILGRPIRNCALVNMEYGKLSQHRNKSLII